MWRVADFSLSASLCVPTQSSGSRVFNVRMSKSPSNLLVFDVVVIAEVAHNNIVECVSISPHPADTTREVDDA